MTNIKNKKRLTSIIIAACFAIIACLSVYAAASRLIVSPLRRALPWTAREVREWHWDEGGMTGQDYIHLLKARITEQQFRRYVDKLGLEPYPSLHAGGPGPDWGIYSYHANEELTWWTPPDNSSHIYVRQDGMSWIYAQWEDGYVYVNAFNI